MTLRLFAQGALQQRLLERIEYGDYALFPSEGKDIHEAAEYHLEELDQVGSSIHEKTLIKQILKEEDWISAQLSSCLPQRRSHVFCG